MNKNKKLWIGVISFVLAFLVFVVLLTIQKSMNEDPVYEEVVCAKISIPQNINITEQNADQYFECREVPVDWLPEEYFLDVKDLYGMVLKADISAGSIMTKSFVTERKTYYKGYQNLTWISVPIDELYKGVAGRLRTGDYIDIYMLSEGEQGYRCSLVAEKVRVEATYSDQGISIEENSADGLSQLIIIPMERDQVPVFYEILAQGNIRIAKYEEV